eukprot:11159511-Lingulodinium_polyedra.AAC.1
MASAAKCAQFCIACVSVQPMCSRLASMGDPVVRNPLRVHKGFLVQAQVRGALVLGAAGRCKAAAPTVVCGSVLAAVVECAISEAASMVMAAARVRSDTRV